MPLDTYEAELDRVLIESLGHSEEDAREALEAWLKSYTNGYHIKDFYLKKRFDAKDWYGI